MDRSLERVRLDVIVGVSEIVRHVKYKPPIKHKEADERETVLHGEIGMERQSVLGCLFFDSGRIVRSMNMQRPDMQNDDARDHERQEIVERKEAVEGRVIDRVATPQPG